MRLKIIIRLVFAAVITAVTTSLIAQWAVDMGSPVRVQAWGDVTSVRYGYVNQPYMMVRGLPSENRHLTMSSGLLPSENRMLRQQSGFLPSQGRAAHLAPQYSSFYSNISTPNFSVRYGNPAYGQPNYSYAAPGLSRLTPTLAYTSVKSSPFSLSSVSVPAMSVRYGSSNSVLTPGTPPVIPKPVAPPAVPLPNQAQQTKPSTISQPSPLFRPGTYTLANQSIRYGQTGTGNVPW